MAVVLLARNPTDTVTHGLLPAAHDLGLPVRVLTDEPEAHRRAYADLPGRPEVVGCAVSDVRAVLATIEATGTPIAVISNSDHLQVQTALVAHYLELPGKDWRSAQRARDKGLMRARLRSAGLDDTPCYRLVPGTDTALPNISYPVVLKPAEGVASEDVVLVRDRAELGQRVGEVRSRRGGDLLVEGLLEGPLTTLETLGDGSRRRVLGSWQTRVSPPPFFIEERLTWNARPDPAVVAAVLAQLDRLGAGFGACHTEFVLTAAGPRLVEVNDRLIGDHCDFAMARLIDEPLFHDLLRLLLGEPLKPPPADPKAGAGVVHWVLVEADGVLREAPGEFTDTRRWSGSGYRLDYRPMKPVGTAVRVTGTNRDYLGSVTVTGPDPVGVEAVTSEFLAGGHWVIG
jgi:biotin carboxylase